MPCYHPVTAWHSAKKNASGKRSLVFSAAGGFGLPLQIPCGGCIGCRLDKAKQWAVRCTHEASLHALNSFVTLTYSDVNLPDDGSLNHHHLQLFFKKLRKAGYKTKYFVCGEYGGTNPLTKIEDGGLYRPHYHALLFGVWFDDLRFHKNGSKGDPVYTSPTLDKIWGLGECYIGSVTAQSAAYCARYTLKKITGDMAPDHYGSRKPEYATMSTRPAIAKDWFEKFQSSCYPDDFVVHDKAKTKVPRYYDKQIPEKQLLALKDKRKALALTRRGDATPGRLRVREAVKKSQIQTLKRS